MGEPAAGAVVLHSEERGSGRPLVILHGLLGSIANWRGIARTLSESLRVVSLDARNHGRSEHAAAHGYAVMAADTAATMERLGLVPATVMGHSMGGKTAMTLALTRPELVERLIVLDMAPRTYRDAEGPAEVVHALAELDLAGLGSREDVDRALAERIHDAATRSFALMNLKRDPVRGFSWRCNLDVLARSLPDLAAGVESDGTYDGPVLFVRGAWSRYITDSDETRIRALFPAAEVVTLPEAGHWLHVEAPDALIATLSRFLGED